MQVMVVSALAEVGERVTDGAVGGLLRMSMVGLVAGAPRVKPSAG